MVGACAGSGQARLAALRMLVAAAQGRHSLHPSLQKKAALKPKAPKAAGEGEKKVGGGMLALPVFHVWARRQHDSWRILWH